MGSFGHFRFAQLERLVPGEQARVMLEHVDESSSSSKDGVQTFASLDDTCKHVNA